MSSAHDMVELAFDDRVATMLLVKPTDVLIDCVPDAERRRFERTQPGQPPPCWRVSMDGRAVLGLPTFEEAVEIALSWVAHTSNKIYRRAQPYGPPELYEPTAGF